MDFIKIIIATWLIYKISKFIHANNIATKKMEEDILRKTNEEKHEKEKVIKSEIEHADRAYAALPDVEEAIRLLTDRYEWREILEIIGIFNVHLKFIRDIYYSQPLKIKLPNMQSTRYESEENRVISRAKSVIDKRNGFYYNTSFYEESSTYGIDSLAQEPTVLMLRELFLYVETKEPITNESRSFTCKLTQKGEALILLDNKYSKGNIAPYIRHAPCSEARSKISKVLYRAVSLLEPVK